MPKFSVIYHEKDNVIQRSTITAIKPAYCFADMLQQSLLMIFFEIDGILDLDQRRFVRILGRVREHQHTAQTVLFGVIVVLGADLQAEFVEWFTRDNCFGAG